jgi:hypothetical protein
MACRQWLEGSTQVLSQEAGTIQVVLDPVGGVRNPQIDRNVFQYGMRSN